MIKSAALVQEKINDPNMNNLILEKYIGKFGIKLVSFFESYPGRFLLYILILYLFVSIVSLLKNGKRSRYFLVLWTGLFFSTFMQILCYMITEVYSRIPIFFIGFGQAVIIGYFISYWTKKLLEKDNFFAECSATPKNWLSAFSGISDLGKSEIEINNSKPVKSISNFFKSRYKFLITLLLLLLAALPIRVWRFAEYPEFIHCEYASAGRKALDAISTKTPYIWKCFTSPMPEFLFFVDGLYALCTDAFAFLFLLFGSSFTVMKILPTFLGIVSVILIWRFGKRWMGDGVGATAAFFMAVCPWMISLSRHLWSHVILCVVYEIIALHLILVSLNKPNFKNICITFLSVFLSVYLYRPTVILIPIMIIFFMINYIKNPDWRKKAMKPIVISAVLSILLIAPFLRYCYLVHYFRFIGTTSVNYNKDESALLNIQNNLASFISVEFYVKKEPMYAGISESLGSNGFLHIPLMSTLFTIGLGCTIMSFRKRQVDQMLLVCAFLSIFPYILSLSPPPRRLIMFEPVMFLMAGRGAIGLMGWFAFTFNKKLKYLFILLISVFCIFLLSASYGIYQRKSNELTIMDLRIKSEHISKSILSENFVLLMQNDYGLEDSVYILTANKYNIKEVGYRLSIMLNLNHYIGFDLPEYAEKLKMTEFLWTPDDKVDPEKISEIEMRFQEFRQKYPRWKMNIIRDKFFPQKIHYVSIKFPSAEFKEVKFFILTTIFNDISDKYLKWHIPEAWNPENRIIPINWSSETDLVNTLCLHR